MEEQILQIIKDEDSKNPLTDEEIASRLQVFREDVTTVRRKHHIPDSRKRRKPVIFEDMKRILTENPDLSDRGLTRMLEDIRLPAVQAPLLWMSCTNNIAKYWRVNP